MNAEVKNDINTNSTVEQNQNSAADPLVSGIPKVEPEAGAAPPRPLAGSTALQATITLNQRQGRPSKVSQLPPEIIAFVNEELLRRVPARIIAEELAEKGYPGFNKDNLSSWKLGPFKRWALAQQTLDQQNRQRELALDYARTRGTSLLEVLEEIHAHNLYETALGLNPAGIVGKIRENPELFLKVNREISGFVRIFREKKARSASVEKRLESNHSTGWEREKNGGLTEEERDKVAWDLGIFPPPDMLPTPSKVEPEPVTEDAPNCNQNHPL
ncbi:MAG: hypothetical protein JWM16_5093 [Verrucomicrobiales bacterium]|nr:hypothetical protein [Verrucomicrobiales bacterium]